MYDRLIKFGRYAAGTAAIVMVFIHFLSDTGGDELVPYLSLLSGFTLLLHGLLLKKENRKSSIEGYLFLFISGLVIVAV